MGYLVQKTRASQLTVGGVDYTSSFISLQVSDVSAFKNGLMTTSGTLVLGQRPGGSDIEDYDRNIFKRGTVVILDITEPGGSAYRHPRGYLHVISVSYNVEAEQLEIAVGCRLALAFLTDDASEVLPLIPIPLDPAQQTIQNCSASFASAGKVLYQDNQGALQERKFFGTDNSSGVEAGEFVSILGQTALSVTPLAAGNAIPDVIRLSYLVPQGVLAGGEPVKETTDTTISDYFIAYPAVTYTRVPLSEIGDACLPEKKDTQTSNCGNTPLPPGNEAGNAGEQEDVLCECQWESKRNTVYLPATKTSVSQANYGGPAGQLSYQLTSETGPAIEANSQYFADKYAYCSRVYGYSCTPNGGCPYDGFNQITLGRSATVYTYNPDDNSLQRTVTETYRTKLSISNPDNWRSGVNNGVPQDFNQNFATNNSDLFRERVQIVEYSRENNLNKQVTTIYTSISSIGVSSGANLDAYAGFKTTETRLSATNVVNDIKPDATISPTTQTAEQTRRLVLSTNSYITPPSEAGDYELKESVPVPLLSENEAQVEDWLDDYSEYLSRFVKGDLYGLQIGESMRSEIVTGWYPGRPFRYVDPQNNKITAMRMDACAWGVTSEEAVVVMNGVWNGFSNGTLVLGDNLVGNSTPSLDGSAVTPPPGSAANPSIANDVVGQSFVFEIDIDLRIDPSMFFYGNDGVVAPNPDFPENYTLEMTLVPFVGGIVVETGGLLETTGSGSLPLEYGGLLVTENATIVDPDVFTD